MFKGRVVFDGSDVIDQDKNATLFQELAVSATAQASEAADASGLPPRHDLQQADARHTHAQLAWGGTPTWAMLPKEAWPESWAGMRDP
eukprot:4023987-Pyramimonas_sp.AAC.1